VAKLRLGSERRTHGKIEEDHSAAEAKLRPSSGWARLWRVMKTTGKRGHPCYTEKRYQMAQARRHRKAVEEESDTAEETAAVGIEKTSMLQQ